jgi:regulator of cell morphogenesis and NO signaling
VSGRVEWDIPPTMNTTIETTLTPESRIGDLVAAHPALARHFEALGIDYCCGGKQTLAAVCAARNLALATVTARLEVALARPAAPEDIDAATLSLTALADHIEATHHAYLKDELPRLVELADKVADAHGERDGRLKEVAATTRELAEEMICHMQKEEFILFPLVRQIDAGGRGQLEAGIADPIRQMEAEHEEAGAAIARLRMLTDGFAPGADACNTHRALLHGLACFEVDLHRHVHKENNILFPRALERVAG